MVGGEVLRDKGKIVVLDKRGLSNVIAKILDSGASWPGFVTSFA